MLALKQFIAALNVAYLFGTIMAGNLVMVQSFAEKMISVVIVKSATKLKQQKHQELGLHGGGNY
jgi:hypothetical protein